MPTGLGVSLGLGGGRAATSGGGAPASFPNVLSVDFDGSDDYIDLPDSTDFEVTAFTWSIWFKVDAVDVYSILVDTSTDVSFFNGFVLFVKNSDNKVRFASYASADAIDSTTVISAGTWYHVAATHAAGDDQLYVNGGTAEASGVAGNFAVSDAANLRLASSQQFSLYTSGLLDEVSFYNSALSAADVDDVYNGGTPTDLGPDGLNLSPVGWWRMGDGDTYDILTDHGSGGNDGTMKNMLAGDIVADVP